MSREESLLDKCASPFSFAIAAVRVALSLKDVKPMVAILVMLQTQTH